jgi:hypothetical protein
VENGLTTSVSLANGGAGRSSAQALLKTPGMWTCVDEKNGVHQGDMLLSNQGPRILKIPQIVCL